LVGEVHGCYTIAKDFKLFNFSILFINGAKPRVSEANEHHTETSADSKIPQAKVEKPVRVERVKSVLTEIKRFCSQFNKLKYFI
jgi:hypothetical protein